MTSPDELRRQCEEILAASEKATRATVSAENTTGLQYFYENAELIVLFRNLAPVLAEHTLRLLNVYEAAEAYDREREKDETRWTAAEKRLDEALAALRAGRDNNQKAAG